MAFKIFIHICNLLIPMIMVLFGNVFVKHPPEKINMVYGYRTKRSMKNQETWNFAHEYCGKIWKKAGGIMLVMTLVSFAAAFFLDDNAYGNFSVVLIHAQLVVLIGSTYQVERMLKKNFDDGGNKKPA